MRVRKNLIQFGSNCKFHYLFFLQGEYQAKLSELSYNRFELAVFLESIRKAEKVPEDETLLN